MNFILSATFLWNKIFAYIVSEVCQQSAGTMREGFETFLSNTALHSWPFFMTGYQGHFI